MSDIEVEEEEKIISVSMDKGIFASKEEKRLTLAYESLRELPHNLIMDYGPIIEILDLSNNQISDVSFLSHFPKVTTLILDHNLITDTTLFPHLPFLTTLWINHNSITNLHPFIQQVSDNCPHIKCLSLMGNDGAPSWLNGGTYYQYLQYRLFVISCIPGLEYLDDRQVTDDQRREARRLYGTKLYRTLKHILNHNPGRILQKMKEWKWNNNWNPFRECNENDDTPTFHGEGRILKETTIPTSNSDSSMSLMSQQDDHLTSHHRRCRKNVERNLVI